MNKTKKIIIMCSVLVVMTILSITIVTAAQKTTSTPDKEAVEYTTNQSCPNNNCDRYENCPNNGSCPNNGVCNNVGNCPNSEACEGMKNYEQGGGDGNQGQCMRVRNGCGR